MGCIQNENPPSRDVVGKIMKCVCVLLCWISTNMTGNESYTNSGTRGHTFLWVLTNWRNFTKCHPSPHCGLHWLTGSNSHG